jgi:hypothetical protein
MLLILQILQETSMHLSNEFSSDLVYGTFGVSAIIATAVAVGGGLIKTAIASTGIKDKKEQAAEDKAELDAAIEAVEDFEHTNAFEGLKGAEYEVEKADLATLGPVAQLGKAKTMQDAAQGTVGTLAKSKGYSAKGYSGEGYSGEGYSAQGTNIGGLQRGANTGLTNNMNNLQVSTAAADMAAQEADQSLAASQDLAAQAGTGAGGATALAAAAAKSKQGISASIDQQVKSNEMMRAQGESELQRSQLAQGNLASNFDLGQSQFNVTAQNQAAQFGAGARNTANQFSAGARNEANRFTADAENQASKFTAQAANQFALSRFTEGNAMSRSNAGARNQVGLANNAAENAFSMADIAAQNDFAKTQFSAENRNNEYNANALNEGAKFNAQGQYAADTTTMGGAERMENDQYGTTVGLMNVKGGISAASQGAVNNQQQQIKGAWMDTVDAGTSTASAATGGFDMSDRRLKKNIKQVAISINGYKIYNFEYKDTKHGKGIFQGVMSDEVPEYAVVKNNDGFDTVDYSVIDVEFKNI